METDKYSKTSDKSLSGSEQKENIIIVRAIITCPSCNFNKKFKNQFPRKDLELMVVALKVFDWMACNKCGDLLNLDLEFKI